MVRLFLPLSVPTPLLLDRGRQIRGYWVKGLSHRWPLPRVGRRGTWKNTLQEINKFASTHVSQRARTERVAASAVATQQPASPFDL